MGVPGDAGRTPGTSSHWRHPIPVARRPRPLRRDERLLGEATAAQCSGVDAVFGHDNAWGLGFGVDADLFLADGTPGGLLRFCDHRPGRSVLPSSRAAARAGPIRTARRRPKRRYRPASPAHLRSLITTMRTPDGRQRRMQLTAARRRSASALMLVREVGPPSPTSPPRRTAVLRQLVQQVTCRTALVSFVVPVSTPIASAVGRMTRSTLRRRASSWTCFFLDLLHHRQRAISTGANH